MTDPTRGAAKPVRITFEAVADPVLKHYFTQGDTTILMRDVEYELEWIKPEFSEEDFPVGTVVYSESNLPMYVRTNLEWYYIFPSVVSGIRRERNWVDIQYHLKKNPSARIVYPER